eukprot:4142109-Prymnesium_polylepis.1
MNRALAHKPVEVRVLLQSLIAQTATHPKIAKTVTETAFFDWLGTGQFQMADRAMEALNKVQNDRMSKFTGCTLAAGLGIRVTTTNETVQNALKRFET